MFYLYLNKCCLKQLFVEIFFPLQIAKVAYFERKINLSGFPAYPNARRPSLSGLVKFYCSSIHKLVCF